MVILGIDPGTAMMGWGVIESSKFKVKSSKFPLTSLTSPGTSSLRVGKVQSAKSPKEKIKYVAHGAMKTESVQAMPERLLSLKRQLDEVIKRHQPDCIVVERLFFGRNVQTAMSVERARGVVMLMTAELGLPFFEYHAPLVKKLLSGSGRSDKQQMERAVARFLNLRKLPKPDDAADALAIAICHALKKDEEVKEDRKTVMVRDGNGRFVQKIKTEKKNPKGRGR